MCRDKHAAKGSLLYFVAFFAAFFVATVAGNNVFAAATNGIITASDGVRWEYNLTDEELTIRFYDKPADLATVTVPSLTNLISLVPGAPSSLDTYFLKNAVIADQDAAYASSYPRRTATVDTTKLDLGGTSKIQILGVEPIINSAIETEVVFGPNIVIQDNEVYHRQIWVDVCNNVQRGYYGYYCGNSSRLYFDVPDYRHMTREQLLNYTPVLADIGCEELKPWNQLTSRWYDEEYDPNGCNVINGNYGLTDLESEYLGAFSGYKLKLTNFTANNFNYIGHRAFRNSTLNDANTSVTISENTPMLGGEIFAGSNVKNITINTSDYGHDMFMGCTGIESVTFGSAVDTIVDGTFSGTNLTNINFAGTNIKTIGARAFDGAQLSDINLEGVQRINYRAFANNNLREIYLPKSINYLKPEIFVGNNGLKKATVAYDTLTSGTTLPFDVVMDGSNVSNGYSYSGCWGQTIRCTLEELVIIAPYEDGEAVSPTHVTYEDYRYHYDDHQNYRQEVVVRGSFVSEGYGHLTDATYTKSDQFEDDYADVESKKNIIAPMYFSNMPGLKKITIGDGYEFIGTSAFLKWSSDYEAGETWKDWLNNPDNAGGDSVSKLEEVILPDSLKGIGNQNFGSLNNKNLKINIPRNIEFIGIGAFRKAVYLSLDFDFPNLVALGDLAFESTLVRNVTLNDKLRYVGQKAFVECPKINDITFDLDVFSQSDDGPRVTWTRTGSGYGTSLRLPNQFGFYIPSGYPGSNDPTNFVRSEDNLDPFSWLGFRQKYGTITFTNKAKTAPPESYFGHDTGFFGMVKADKVDMSQTGWKILQPRMFELARIGQVLLPETLEIIPYDTFNHFTSDNEIVLPDTVKIIGAAAFNSGYYASAGTPNLAATPIIKKLPSSLEFVGAIAFNGDYNLQADLNSPNLKFVDSGAFQGTRLRDVYLPEGMNVRASASFSNISTLRNITIDYDWGNSYYTSAYSFDFPDSLPSGNKAYIDPRGSESLGIAELSSGSVYSYIDYDRWEVITTYNLGYNPNTNQRVNVGYAENFFQMFSKNMRASSQLESGDTYGILKFTEKATTNICGSPGAFSGLTFEEVDMSATGWTNLGCSPNTFNKAKIGTLKLPQNLDTVTSGAFFEAEIEQPFALPNSTRSLGSTAFQWAKGTITNMLPDRVESIGYAAFFGTDMGDDLTIPSSVTSIGGSAFNAGSADVYYDTVTIEPDLTYAQTNNQLVHQFMWHSKVDKMIVKSNTLPALAADAGAYTQEFWNMPLTEAVIENLPGISWGAFDSCKYLTKIDMSKDRNLRLIRDEAFLNAKSLNQISFSPALEQETVVIGQNAFKGTAFKTIGTSSDDINLRAAKFDGSAGRAFSGMPLLEKVSVPNTFSNGVIPEATFHNDPELVEVTVDYRISRIDNAAFSNDNKLKRIFIWGNNTEIRDEQLPDYSVGAGGQGADGDDEDEYGITIPEGTDIYAYSTSPAEQYAAHSSRENFEGNFYPLDEVLYLTTNKTRVRVDDDETDFDKTNLIVYGLRRDGIVLESDEWATFDGNAFPRSQKNLTFAKMDATIAADPAAGTIWDTPVPLNELSLTNENFENIDSEIARDEDGVAGVRLISILYRDAYTNNLIDTDLLPYTGEPELPITIDNISAAISLFGIAVATAAGMLIVSRKTLRRR